ncbi:MAG: type II toxin-antitoxin system Phd/YefM family antitoxin [Gammaproteobacteria bacterium]|nr:type II toxin-antitoxin system Phd/YefM family antitoxin [Gammaproteobacteria bacterium]MBQ0839753.1 type II toxin-antitoxin system Phd/YefM family antitoxin [Gammaproteobacteria bacterium]
MQVIKASEFKAKCLHLMDVVNETNEEIIITKNGKPVSRLLPYKQRVDSLFGLHKGKLHSQDSLVDPVDEQWSVEE